MKIIDELSGVHIGNICGKVTPHMDSEQEERNPKILTWKTEVKITLQAIFFN